MNDTKQQSGRQDQQNQQGQHNQDPKKQPQNPGDKKLHNDLKHQEKDQPEKQPTR